jgi:hypothetical protein
MELPSGTPEIEHVWHSVSGARTVAVASPDPAQGATTLALALARRAGRALPAGRSALLIGMGPFPAFLSAIADPVPGETAVIGDRLSIMRAPSPADAGAWGEQGGFADALRELSAAWDTIVIDARPVLVAERGCLSGAAACGAAEATVMVSLTGRNPANRVADAVSAIRRAGGAVTGVVMNDVVEPPLGMEIDRLVSRVSRLAPGIAERLRGLMLRSPIMSFRA